MFRPIFRICPLKSDLETFRDTRGSQRQGIPSWDEAVQEPRAWVLSQAVSGGNPGNVVDFQYELHLGLCGKPEFVGITCPVLAVPCSKQLVNPVHERWQVFAPIK